MIYHEINDESNDDIDIFRLNFFKTIKKKNEMHLAFFLNDLDKNNKFTAIG